MPVAEVEADYADPQVCMAGKWSNAHAIVYVSRFRCRLIHLLGIKKPKFIYTRPSSAPYLEDLGPAETGVAPLFGYLVHSYPSTPITFRVDVHYSFTVSLGTRCGHWTENAITTRVTIPSSRRSLE